MDNTQSLTLDQLSNILESLDDAVFVIDLDKKITFCNAAAIKLTGQTKQSLVSKAFSAINLIRKRDRSNVQDYLDTSLTEGKSVTLEGVMLFVDPSGNEMPVKITVSPLFDPGRHILGSVIVLRNFLPEQENLMIRSDFSYFQHQIGSPIAGSLWNLQLAIDASHDPEEKKNLQRIKNSIESIRVITVKMLLASRLGQGLINPKIETFDLDSVLTPLTEEEKTKNQEKNIILKVEKPDEKVSLKTDKEFLANTLKEILENSRLYSHENSDIDFIVSTKDNGVLFEVKDTGIGIPQNELSSVFTKFFRGVNIKEIPGAGLGLHIALQYAKLISAQIWFTSKENEGTNFSVFVPNQP